MREVELGEKRLVIAEEESGDAAGKTGASVWDCSLVLAHWLENSCFRKMPKKGTWASLLGLTDTGFSGKRVVELGAGTGLAGLSAALFGAQEVVLTDRAPLLPLLQRNVSGNVLEDRVRVEELEWGNDCSALSPPFDFVICSDVMYDVGSMQALAKTMLDLCGDAGSALVAYELREGAGDCFQVLQKSGLRWAWVPVEELHPDWHSDDIRLFVMSKG